MINQLNRNDEIYKDLLEKKQQEIDEINKIGQSYLQNVANFGQKESEVI